MNAETRARELSVLALAEFSVNVDRSPGHGPAGDCHVWTGVRDPRGYGRIRNKLATHFALLFSGRERPSTSHGALHSCDTTSCVNPAHLRWGTQKENAGDASNRLRYPNARKTHCPRGHEYTKENTLSTERPEGWKDRRCRQCDIARKARARAKRRDMKAGLLAAAPGDGAEGGQRE
jgi:hypothetical protein